MQSHNLSQLVRIICMLFPSHLYQGMWALLKFKKTPILQVLFLIFPFSHDHWHRSYLLKTHPMSTPLRYTLSPKMESYNISAEWSSSHHPMTFMFQNTLQEFK